MVIATYACCGFGSIAAVGVYMGAMISVAPDRRHDISSVAMRACVNGNLAGFLTACIAGRRRRNERVPKIIMKNTIILNCNQHRGNCKP